MLLGKGALNVSGGEQQVEGFPAGTPEVMFGGGANPDNTHDCGKLKYVRIEYAGYILSGDNETNGLTIGGCGDKTEIDYVQVHKGSDDGVEIFGGAVNIKHVVISQGLDDSLDWDLGWTGKAQFVVIQQDPGQGNYGFESDSNGSTPKQAPISNPEIFNVTLVGAGNGKASKEQGGMLLREGTGGRMANFVITEFKDFVINVAGKETIEHAYTVTGDAEPYTFELKASGEQQLFLKNSMFFANGYDTNGQVAGGNRWPTPEPAMKDGKVVEKGDITFDQKAFFELPELPQRGRRSPADQRAEPDRPQLRAQGRLPRADGWPDASERRLLRHLRHLPRRHRHHGLDGRLDRVPAGVSAATHFLREVRGPCRRSHGGARAGASSRLHAGMARRPRPTAPTAAAVSARRASAAAARTGRGWRSWGGSSARRSAWRGRGRSCWRR